MKQITITSDGACHPNPGRGGWAAILRYGTSRKEISGHLPEATCNTAELQAAIEGFRAVKEPCKILFRTDSMYVIYAIRRRGTKKKTKSNKELVLELWAAIEKHDVEALWVRGHSGDPDNERCDLLAEDQARRPF